MDLHIALLRKQLKAVGSSVTKPRLEVFSVLYTHGLLTMQQLVEYCDSNRASVYRAVANFEKIGIIQRMPVGFRYKLELSDQFMPHHHHISCVRCGATQNIHSSKLEYILNSISDSTLYTHVSHRLELMGVCQQCGVSSSIR